MVSDIALFSSPPLSVNVKINLPNNEIATATYIGIVVLHDKLTLYNVLFVPGFSFNLLSISHLTRHSACIVTFLSTHCVLQDQLSMNVIGTAEQEGGLYHLNFKLDTHCVNNVVQRSVDFKFCTLD